MTDQSLSNVLKDIEPNELDEFFLRLYVAAEGIRDQLIIIRKQDEQEKLEKAADGQKAARRRYYLKNKEKIKADARERYQQNKAAALS